MNDDDRRALQDLLRLWDVTAEQGALPRLAFGKIIMLVETVEPADLVAAFPSIYLQTMHEMDRELPDIREWDLETLAANRDRVAQLHDLIRQRLARGNLA